MKYFTKFLPVEGEIKEGDKYITGCGNVYTSTTPDHSDIIKATSKEQFNEYFKKVKLFLCSRDIQVGDKVYQNNIVTKEWSGFGELFSYEPSINSYGIDLGHTTTMATPEELVKVIGEISKEATWVKEGDEFNEDQITKLEYGYHSNCPLQECEKENKCLYNGWMECSPNIIKILGPCGHFH